MSAFFRTWPERAPAALDIGLLPIRDRACLRLLDRYESATADQLAILVHPTLRTSQRRLRRLWRLGLLERSPLMPEHGGIPMAYRLSHASADPAWEPSIRAWLPLSVCATCSTSSG